MLHVPWWSNILLQINLDGGDVGHETIANLNPLLSPSTFFRKGNFDQNAVFSLRLLSPSLSSTAALSPSLTFWLVPEGSDHDS